MSENLQHNQSQYFVQSSQYKLNQMNSDDVENGHYSKCFLSSDRYNFCNEYESESMPWNSLGDSSYYDANAKIQSDLSVVRDCLGHRLQTEEQAISSLLEGSGQKKNPNKMHLNFVTLMII